MSEQSENSLFELAQGSFRPADYAALTWEGSFSDYLQLVERDPMVARNAWQRLLDMIESHGFDEPLRRGEPKRWRVFSDPFGRGRDFWPRRAAFTSRRDDPRWRDAPRS